MPATNSSVRVSRKPPAIFNELNREEGNGGLIAVDKDGNFTMPFNCSGMYRGYLYKEKGTGKVVEAYGINDKLIEKQ